jgi:hypothetical protein
MERGDIEYEIVIGEAVSMVFHHECFPLVWKTDENGN